MLTGQAIELSDSAELDRILLSLNEPAGAAGERERAKYDTPKSTPDASER